MVGILLSDEQQQQQQRPAMASSSVHSQTDMRSVSACVQAVAAAYADAENLVERIKAARRDSTASYYDHSRRNDDDDDDDDLPDMDALEDSLRLGPPLVRGQYGSDLKRLGDVYASGDPAARESLKDIVIHLQLTLLATLRMALVDNVSLDVDALQAASDNSRVDAVWCLSQLGERMADGNHRDSNGINGNSNININGNSNSNGSSNTNSYRYSYNYPYSNGNRGSYSSSGRDTNKNSFYLDGGNTPRTNTPPPATSRRASTPTLPPTLQSPRPPTNESTPRPGEDCSTPRARSATPLHQQRQPDQQQQQQQQSHVEPHHDSEVKANASASLGAPDAASNRDQQRRIEGAMPEQPPPDAPGGTTTTDLVPHPLWTAPENRPYNEPGGALASTTGGTGRNDDRHDHNEHNEHNEHSYGYDYDYGYPHYQPPFHPAATDGQLGAPFQSTVHIQSREFIAELEDPNPIIRPQSQPTDSVSQPQQSGNAVFISADISFLIGPGPDDPFGGPFGPVEPDTAKPLPPNPQNPNTTTTTSTTTTEAEPAPSKFPLPGKLSPRQSPTANNNAADSGVNNPRPGTAGGVGGAGGSNTGKNSHKNHGGGMLTGLRDRAKRLAQPPHPHPQPTKAEPQPQPQKQDSNSSSKGRNMGPLHRTDDGGKGRNMAVPRGLNFSGIKRGLGISSSNASTSQLQHHDDKNHALAADNMTYVTELNAPVYMPSEENNFAGFCKGAWRLQNQMEGSFVLHSKPAGMYGRSYMWCCSKCTFEVPVDKSFSPTAAPTNTSHSSDNNANSSNHRSRPPNPWSNHPARQILAHHKRQNSNAVSGGGGGGQAGTDTSSVVPSSHSGSARSSGSSAGADGHGNANANTANANNGSNGSAGSGFERIVHTHPGTGIRYRWLFLAKCHVHSRMMQTAVNGVTGNGFGCIFCCSLMKGSAPVFGNLHSFLEHLTGHAAEDGCTEGSGSGTVVGGGAAGGGYMAAGNVVSYVPGTELLKRTKCIVGRVARDHEEFDVNIPPRISEVI